MTTIPIWRVRFGHRVITLEEAAAQANVVPSVARLKVRTHLGGGPREITQQEFEEALEHPNVEIAAELIVGTGVRAGVPAAMWLTMELGTDGVHLTDLGKQLDIRFPFAEAEDLRDEVQRMVALLRQIRGDLQALIDLADVVTTRRRSR